MATAATIITAARYELKDTGGTNYTTNECLAYINECVRKLVEMTCRTWPDFWSYTGQTYKATSNIVAATAYYALPNDFYHLIQITLTSSTGDVTPLDELDLARAVDADAEGYYLADSKVYILPVPTVSVTSGLNVYYVNIPTTLTSDTQNVALGNWFQDLITQYVVLKCKNRQGTLDPTITNALLRDGINAARSYMTTTNKYQRTKGMNPYHRSWI